MAINALRALAAMVVIGLSGIAVAKEQVVPMYGGTLIEGYNFGKDTGPKGSMNFDAATGEFKGSYTGLKMPEGRRAIFAWVHDTVNQRSEYIGPVGLLKTGTGGKNKGRYAIKVPERFKNGDFGSHEILAFSAEKNEMMTDDGKVVSAPTEPKGSDKQKALKPAFYLYAALPGADTDLHYCGHGQDFFLAKAPEKQICYD